MKKHATMLIFLFLISMMCWSHYEEFMSPNRVAGKSRPWNNYGTALFVDGQLGLAYEAFLRALEINPNDKDCINNIGYCFFVKKDYSRAIYCYKKALSISPIDTNIMINLGAALISYSIKSEGLDFLKSEGLDFYLSALKRDKEVNNGLFDTHLGKFIAACRFLRYDSQNNTLVAEYMNKINEIVSIQE